MPGSGGSPIERKTEAVGSGRATVIEPSRGWVRLNPAELWRYRELLGTFVLRDLALRYRQTFLGASWVILRPLLTMALFTLVFGWLVRVPSEGYPYAIFVFAALLPWTYFANAVTSAGSSVIAASGLVSKVYFPRILIPVAAAIGGVVDLLVSVVFLLAIMPFFGVPFTAGLLAVPALFAALFLAALGVGILFAAVTVAYRDTGGLLAFFLQAWMYATPVIYPSSLVPERWRFALLLNPMTGLVEAFRSCVGRRRTRHPKGRGWTTLQWSQLPCRS